MTAGKRKTVLVVVTGVLLAVLAGWSYGRLFDARTEAARVRKELASCDALAARIEQLRTRPNRAGAAEMELSVMAGRIERAAGAAGLAAETIVRIWPEPARRAGDTVYREKPTQVLLREVGRRQLTAFLHALTAGDSELTVRSLRLSAPRERQDEDVWNAEVVITYLIYAPAKAARGGDEDRGLQK